MQLSNHSQRQRLQGRRCARGTLQFAEHALDVGAHRARADAQVARHFLVARPTADALQNLRLAFAEQTVAGLADHRSLIRRPEKLACDGWLALLLRQERPNGQ